MTFFERLVKLVSPLHKKGENMKAAPLDLVKVEEVDINLDEFDWKKLCLTTKEACRLLGVGRTKFWEIADSLPSVNVTGGRRFWCRKGLERWVEANTTTP